MQIEDWLAVKSRLPFALLLIKSHSLGIKEDVFAFKLASFELDVVKNCKDKTHKAAIRKSQSPLEVVKAISEIK